jgi:putative intracellular protease/amidase
MAHSTQLTLFWLSSTRRKILMIHPMISAKRIVLTSIILTLSFVSTAAKIQPLPFDQKENKQVTVAIVLFDGVQIIDYSGPWEVFGQAGFKVFTVADKTEVVTTRFDQKVIADYSFDNGPDADIILIPGGRGTLKAADNPRAIKWIQEKATNARYVVSVCTGAFLLARTGLLDGLTATTFHSAIGSLTQAAPKTKIVYDQRYVDNGKVITTAGLSSGIDGALHVVEKILGKGTAQFEALGLEYNWQGDQTPARAAFADRYLPDLEGIDGDFVSVEGDLNHWDMHALISKPSSVGAIMDVMRKKLATTPHTSTAVTIISRPSKSAEAATMEWRFADDLGRAWMGLAAAGPATVDKGKVDMTLRLTRDKK